MTSSAAGSSTLTFLVQISISVWYESRISIGNALISTRLCFLMLNDSFLDIPPSFTDNEVIFFFFISCLIYSNAAVCFLTTLFAASYSADMSRLINSNTRSSNRLIANLILFFVSIGKNQLNLSPLIRS
ncbi:hypothetical protein DFS34DRAFT_607593 [Phlyctochytrium arcticum]|nr:hypothetical protein DFS34DRAFT_607538 [Phlyctochytrium arcticum]KAI9103134.1 hypothetical protein DFS34DRAFT_607593 [Phlyctochytrium arcticum]